MPIGSAMPWIATRTPSMSRPVLAAEWEKAGRPLTITHPNGITSAHPLIAVMRDAEKDAARYGEALGLKPGRLAQRMVPACDRFRSAVIEGRLTHDADPALARHIANCVVRESSSGTVITRPDPTRKIDAAVAAVVASDRAAWHAQNPLEVPWVEVVSG
jgi:terminase small subunit-like protein